MLAINLLAAAFLFVAGTAFWTLAEYVLHRWGMHEAKGKGLASREHLRHHASYDSVLESWYLSWLGVLAFGAVHATWATLLVGPAGIALGVGWVAGFGFYEWIHWRAHRRPIANPYERWVRRHHFHHHFGHPMQNHGVTTPIWDLVFGTYVRVDGPVKVPRRLAMVWLVDDHGNVRGEYADDWVLAGRRHLDDEQQAEDLERAFSNLAPTV
ncbi:MAG: sterol desaturase family protein [Actinomycetota bacterium]|nr:sterol desaturase family protein [Actinomycetota bacterium]